MLKSKRGASIISLSLCAIAVVLIISALVVATNNSARFRAEQIANKKNIIEESLAVEKINRIYTKSEVVTVARQAFANNYLALYDGEIDIESFKAVVMGELMQTISVSQLEQYDILITEEGITIK